MKYIIFFIILFFLVPVWSQSKGIVYYGHIESPGMRSAAGPDLNAYLVFDKNESYYVTAKDSLESTTAEPSVITGADGQTTVYTGGSNTFRYGKQVYFNREADSLWWSQRFRGNIYVAESRPKIEWRLVDGTKKFGDMIASKAIGKFRGRNYTAWYVREIPLPYGPWKLQGLPGLIVEVYDDRKEMFIYFKSLEFPTNNQTPISKVQRTSNDSQGWMTIHEFKDMLVESLEKAYNKTVIMSERYGGDTPKRPVFSDVYIESFEN